MTALIGISGSLRQGSFNTALLHAVATLLPADTSPQIRTVHGIPLFDADLEVASGLPESVSALKDLALQERTRSFVAGFVDAVRRSQR
jgi:NAD(P)H-dependent FMN reductase